MASVALVPRAEQDIRTALNVLALNFSLNDKVVEELLKVGVRNLEEFPAFSLRTRLRSVPLLPKLVWGTRPPSRPLGCAVPGQPRAYTFLR